MATGFRSLPLEVRNMIYDHALEDDYDIFTKGVQAILKVCPEITREIYSYRRIYTTIIVTEFPQRMDPFQINRIFGKAKRFNMVEGRKGLVVRCKAMPLPVAISGNENGRTEMQTPTFRALCSLYKRVMLMRAEQWVKLWRIWGIVRWLSRSATPPSLQRAEGYHKPAMRVDHRLRTNGDIHYFHEPLLLIRKYIAIVGSLVPNTHAS